MSIVLTILLAVILIFLSAAFSGLNIGLMMVKPEELALKKKQGDNIAARVYEYRKNGNYLIVCVLLGNVAVISILTLVLNEATGSFSQGLLGSVIAGVATTLLVTAFGEILPQSLFSQRGYRLTRHFFWLLDSIFIIFWPIAKPTSILLDRWIGKELPSLYSHEDFEHMIHEHANHELSSIDLDESRIVTGALSFSQKKVKDIITPMDKVFVLKHDETIDSQLARHIRRSGHSRLPVKNAKNEYVGVVLVKDLIGSDLPVPVGHVYRDRLFDIYENSSLDTALSRCIQTKNHLFVATDAKGIPTGIITLEDIMEEILSQEIEDEYDTPVE